MQSIDETFTYIDQLFASSVAKGEKDPKLLHFLASLLKSAREGHLFLDAPADLVKKLEPLTSGEKSPLVSFENSYYLRRIFELETNAVAQIKRLLKATPDNSFADCPSPEEFYPAQKTAFQTILSSPLTIISGGPGCGKTFFASKLIEAFIEKKPHCSIIAAAPTGKAASRLRFKNVLNGTLHSLLKLYKNSDRDQILTPLIADLILIDECSMIDLELWSKLLSSIQSGSRLVIIGDEHQLPPVETMGIFPSLVKNGSLPHIHFDQCKRTDKMGLLKLAALIRKGDGDALIQLLRSGAYGEVQLKPLPKKIPIDRSTLLTPFVKGPYGTTISNQSIDALRQEKIKPIVIEKNAPLLGLVNGEIGTLVGDKAHFTLLGEEKIFPRAILPSYSLAYAVTVHKSQGSEFKEVSLLLPNESEKFGRELLYTAVTRSREKITIYGEESTLRTIVGRSFQPPSHFNRRLI